MKVTLNVSTSKVFGLVSAQITGNINISHSGGSFVGNILKKKIIKALVNNRMNGTVTIDGETTRT